jgi:hypothetical protein
VEEATLLVVGLLSGTLGNTGGRSGSESVELEVRAEHIARGEKVVGPSALNRSLTIHAGLLRGLNDAVLVGGLTENSVGQSGVILIGLIGSAEVDVAAGVGARREADLEEEVVQVNVDLGIITKHKGALLVQRNDLVHDKVAAVELHDVLTLLAVAADEETVLTNSKTKSTEVSLALLDSVRGDEKSVELHVGVGDDVENAIGLAVEVELDAIEANEVRVTLDGRRAVVMENDVDLTFLLARRNKALKRVSVNLPLEGNSGTKCTVLSVGTISTRGGRAIRILATKRSRLVTPTNPI